MYCTSHFPLTQSHKRCDVSSKPTLRSAVSVHLTITDACTCSQTYCVKKDTHEEDAVLDGTLPDWIVISLCTMLKGAFTFLARLAIHAPDTSTADSVCGEKGDIKTQQQQKAEQKSSDRKSHMKRVFLSPAAGTPQVATHLTFPLPGLSAYKCVHALTERVCAGLCLCLSFPWITTRSTHRFHSFRSYTSILSCTCALS